MNSLRGSAHLDPGLLRRYDIPGPRYTSYPTAPQFGGDFGEGEYREQARRTNAADPPRPLSLYLHIPFCTSPCFYCGCNRVITRDTTAGGRYLERLTREIEMIAPLFDRKREVRQLHFGGGTPNFLSAPELGVLIDALARSFRFSHAVDRDFSIELDPRFIAAADVRRLAQLGLNRASLGVQDFDPRVQHAVNRIQSIAQTVDVIDACRASGFRSVNLDLIYGLPHQTPEGFAQTLRTVIAARPERLAVYGYAHMPGLFKAQRHIDAQALPGPAARIALLELAIERLGAAGYRYIGMDHFALPGDDLSRAQDAGGLHRNFMGYTTHAECDLIGLGMSSISHVGESFSQNHRDLRTWQAALDQGRLPIWRGLSLDPDDVLRADVIQQLMCRGVVDFGAIEQRYGIAFEEYFADSLARLEPLAADELVTLGERHIRVTQSGRFLLRIIAMCFDRYLTAPQRSRAVSSAASGANALDSRGASAAKAAAAQASSAEAGASRASAAEPRARERSEAEATAAGGSASRPGPRERSAEAARAITEPAPSRFSRII
jgi:oxygen-independent coproporphyrinogen III oxidase